MARRGILADFSRLSKKPHVGDFKEDMKALGENLAELFKDKVADNIESNHYKFRLDKSTVARKGSRIPLIDTGEMLDNIYSEGSIVSVRDTPHEGTSLTNKQLAVIHEYGTKDRHIPARPVWRYTFRDFRKPSQRYIKKFLKTGRFPSTIK